MLLYNIRILVYAGEYERDVEWLEKTIAVRPTKNAVFKRFEKLSETKQVATL